MILRSIASRKVFSILGKQLMRRRWTTPLSRQFCTEIEEDMPEPEEAPDKFVIKKIGSLAEAFDLLEQQLDQMNDAQIAYVLRGIGSQIRHNNTRRVEQGLNKKSSQIAIQRVKDGIELFGLGSCINLMVFLRKLSVYRIRNSFSNSELSQLSRVIEAKLKESKQELWMLFGLYIAGKDLKMQLNVVVKEIIEELRRMHAEGIKVPSDSFFAILKTCGDNSSNLSQLERIMCSMIVETDNLVDIGDLSTEKKSYIFIVLSKLRMHLNSPRYFYPQYLTTLRKDLMVV